MVKGISKALMQRRRWVISRDSNRENTGLRKGGSGHDWKGHTRWEEGGGRRCLGNLEGEDAWEGWRWDSQQSSCFETADVVSSEQERPPDL